MGVSLIAAFLHAKHWFLGLLQTAHLRDIPGPAGLSRRRWGVRAFEQDQAFDRAHDGVDFDAAHRISACGNASASRWYIARNVEPRVMTSSTRVIVAGWYDL